MAYDPAPFNALVKTLTDQQSAYSEINSALRAATDENARLTEALAVEQTRSAELTQQLAASNAKVAQLTKDLADCRATTTPPTPTGRPCFGFYRGGMDPNGTYHAAETELGRTIGHILTFHPYDTWAAMVLQNWWLTAFKAGANAWASDYGMVITLALTPKGVSVAQADPAVLKTTFTKIAQQLVANGLSKSYIRIGWESQGDWYPWTSITNPGFYKARFRDAALAMRAVSKDFRFDWNIAGGKKVDINAYPGDDVVDVISIDQYGNMLPNDAKVPLDESFKLATDHGKLWAVTEWGVWGADQPTFVTFMAGYLDTHKHAYQIYFDVNSSADHRLSSWPKSKAAFYGWAPKAICR